MSLCDRAWNRVRHNPVTTKRGIVCLAIAGLIWLLLWMLSQGKAWLDAMTADIEALGSLLGALVVLLTAAAAALTAAGPILALAKDRAPPPPDQGDTP